MFQGATSFNQPLGNWNTSAVQTLSSMFVNAAEFNQPIGMWDVRRVNSLGGTCTYIYICTHSPTPNAPVPLLSLYAPFAMSSYS